MPRKPTPRPTGGELGILRALWRVGATDGRLLPRIRRIQAPPDARPDRAARWQAGALALAGLLLAGLIIYGCAAGRQAAIALADKAKSQAFVPALAEDLARRGILNQARTTADTIAEPIRKDLALTAILSGCLRAEDRAGAEAVAEKITGPAYQAVARLSLNHQNGPPEDYEAVARYDITLRRLAGIQAQTPGRSRDDILKWITALAKPESRYQALLGAAEGIFAAQGAGVWAVTGPAPATRPTATSTPAPATPAADAAEMARLILASAMRQVFHIRCQFRCQRPLPVRDEPAGTVVEVTWSSPAVEI